MRDILIIFIVLLLILVIISVLGGTLNFEKFENDYAMPLHPGLQHKPCVPGEECDKFTTEPDYQFLTSTEPAPVVHQNVIRQEAPTAGGQQDLAIEYFEPGSCGTVSYAPVQ